MYCLIIIGVFVIKVADNKYSFKHYVKNKLTFKGTPHRIPMIDVRDYHDALRMWDNLKFAKYLDAHQNSYYDKLIRKDNYSFLDKLTSYIDKSSFIEKFCE